MDFCDCGGMIVPERQGDETDFKCRSCGKPYEEEGGEMKIVEENTDEKKAITVDQSEETLPTTDDVECDECGNGTAHWWTEQTRSADEPPTRFYRCTECSHTWRVYD